MYLISPYNFGASGSILKKLVPYDVREAGIKTWVKRLEGCPKKFGITKKSPKFGAIF